MAAPKSMPFLLSLVIISLLISRVMPFYLDIPSVHENLLTPLYQNLFGSGLQHQTISLLIASCFTIFTGLVMYFVITGLWIFETRNIIPVVLVMLLLSSGTEQQLMNGSYIIPIVVLSSLLILYSSEKLVLDSKKAFNIALIITTGGIINFYVLLILPLYFGLFIYLRKATFKRSIAIITGVVIPYWILWCILYLNGVESSFADYFLPLTVNFLDVTTIHHGYWIYLPGLTLLAVISFFSFIREYPKMKQNHRDIFLTSNLLAIYALVLSLLGILPYQQAMGMAAVSFSFLFTLFYHMGTKRQVWIFYIFFLGFFATSFILKF